MFTYTALKELKGRAMKVFYPYRGGGPPSQEINGKLQDIVVCIEQRHLIQCAAVGGPLVLVRAVAFAEPYATFSGKPLCGGVLEEFAIR